MWKSIYEHVLLLLSRHLVCPAADDDFAIYRNTCMDMCFCYQVIVCMLPSPISAGGLSLLPNFQKGGGALTGPQFLEGGCWERRGVGDFFQGGGGDCNFLTKNKLKSGMLNDKNFYTQNFFALLQLKIQTRKL